MQLLKLKVELLEKERELNVRQQQMENSKTKTTRMSGINISSYFDVAKEMLPEYSGCEDFNVWMTHVKNVKAIYSLDDNMIRVLVMSKIKMRPNNGCFQNQIFQKCLFICF